MENFFEKQNNLFKALNKCDKVLNEFKEGQRTDIENWNRWHDLRDRIEERIKDLQSQYFSWHFKAFGWVAL